MIKIKNIKIRPWFLLIGILIFYLLLKLPNFISKSRWQVLDSDAIGPAYRLFKISNKKIATLMFSDGINDGINIDMMNLDNNEINNIVLPVKWTLPITFCASENEIVVLENDIIKIFNYEGDVLGTLYFYEKTNYQCTIDSQGDIWLFSFEIVQIKDYSKIRIYNNPQYRCCFRKQSLEISSTPLSLYYLNVWDLPSILEYKYRDEFTISEKYLAFITNTYKNYGKDSYITYIDKNNIDDGDWKIINFDKIDGDRYMSILGIWENKFVVGSTEYTDIKGVTFIEKHIYIIDPENSTYSKLKLGTDWVFTNKLIGRDVFSIGAMSESNNCENTGVFGDRIFTLSANSKGLYLFTQNEPLPIIANDILCTASNKYILPYRSIIDNVYMR